MADMLKVVKKKIKWDLDRDTALLVEVQADDRCMKISKPKYGKGGDFWQEVSVELEKHECFYGVKVSDKSAKEHIEKMIEDQKKLRLNPQYRSGSAENSGPNAMELEDIIEGKINLFTKEEK